MLVVFGHLGKIGESYMAVDHKKYNMADLRLPLFGTHDVIPTLIIYMKKLLDSDWLRVVQFSCNTSAKSVTPVQKV